VKTTHWLILILFVVVVLMIRDPKQTTARITTGEGAAVGATDAIVGGFFTAPGHKKSGG